MILNEEMRAEMTLHHSLEPQVHRQKKDSIEGIPVGISLSPSLVLRHLKTEQSTCENNNCLQNKRHSLK